MMSSAHSPLTCLATRLHGLTPDPHTRYPHALVAIAAAMADPHRRDAREASPDDQTVPGESGTARGAADFLRRTSLTRSLNRQACERLRPQFSLALACGHRSLCSSPFILFFLGTVLAFCSVSADSTMNLRDAARMRALCMLSSIMQRVQRV